MRFVVAAALLVIAGFAGVLAWGALSNLWDTARDGSVATYVSIGVPALVVAVVAVLGAWRALVRR
jgi:TRAP-type C4-dicarboxylate transport system permease small subunit